MLQPPSHLRERPTVRLLVVDQQRRVLLFKFEDAVPLDPTQPDLTVYWVTPGGGVEAGETWEQAAQRELWEETGLEATTIGPWLWRRDRILYLSDESVYFRERYFLVRVTGDEVSLRNLTELERRVYRDHRWWTAEELDASTEIFLPPGFVQLLKPILAGQLPREPIVLVE